MAAHIGAVAALGLGVLTATLTFTIRAAVPDPASAPTMAQVRDKLAGIRAPFIENAGQWDAQAAFGAGTLAGTLFVTTQGRLVYHLSGRAEAPQLSDQARVSAGAPRPRHGRPESAAGQPTPAIPGWSLIETFVDGDSQPLPAHPHGVQSAPANVSYFTGNDASRDRARIATYDRVRLGDVFPGIDVQLRATGTNVEKIFTVAPQQDAARIRVKVEGATGLEVRAGGELVAHTANGPVVYTAPIAFQEDAAGTRRPVDVRYALNASTGTYGFAVSDYDHARPLTIDPLLQSTYLGGTGDDQIAALAIHPHSGEIYVAGYAESTNFPQTGNGGQSSFTGTRSCFISHLSTDLSRVIGSTYLGNGTVQCTALAIHPADGRIYVAGTLIGSSTLPALSGGLQATYGGGSTDGFVSVLSADLTTVVHSSFLGGSGLEVVYAMAIHPVTGYVYVAGRTSSTALPGTAVGTQQTGLGGEDGFIIRLRPDLAAPATYSFITTTDFDEVNGLAVDPLSGDLIAIGQTVGTLLASTLVGAAQTTIGGGGNPDAFVTRLRQDLSAIVRSTYLGGTDYENPIGVAVHPLTGDIYVSGVTGSSGTFPGVAGGAQSTAGGGDESFVSRLRGDLGAILQSTYLGGPGNEGTNGIALALHPVSGEIYVAASTNGSLPAGMIANGEQSTYGGGSSDVFVTRFNAALTQILQSTYLGGTGPDVPAWIAVDPAGGGIIVTGYASGGFPTVAGAVQPAYAGGTGNDGFVSRLSPDLTAVNTIPTPFVFLAQSNVPPGTLRTSNEVKILGIPDGIAAYVTGQPDSLLCDTDRPGCCVVPTPTPYCTGAYVSGWIAATSPGFDVFNNDYISVRHTSPNTVGNAETRFIMGGVATSFRTSSGNATFACNLDMDGDNKLDALKEGLVLLRAMFGLTGTAVTAGTGIATPWATLRQMLNAGCGTAF